MKQRIEARQLMELDDDQLETWRGWCNERGYSQRASIGEMIEFLPFEEVLRVFLFLAPEVSDLRGLCDALWDEVKDVLESDGEMKEKEA